MDRKKAVAAQDAAARRYKKKKGDTQGEQPPEKVQKTVTESEVFTELLAFERHLDNLIYKKNLLLQEYPKLHLKRQNRIIRVSVYNTYQNQGASIVVDHTTQRQASEPSSWTLRIDGQLLDTPDNRVDPRQIPKGKKIPKFTSFFKRINVSFDSEQYPDPSHSVEWSKSRIPSSGTNATLLTLFDGQDSVEIKRTGDRETKATILMDFDFQPPRFKLSNPLSKFLDIHTETSARIIHRFFLVVTANNLQDPTDRQKILFPEEIQQLLGCAPSLLISEIPQFLKQHLYPPDPVKLEYNIRLSGDPASFVTQFNVEIDGDESVDLPPLEFQREINQLDAKIEEKLQRFIQHREARDFMLSFSLEPVEFLNNLITSQARDIKIQHAAAYEEQRSHQYYFQPLMIDAATTFLKKDE